MYAAIHHDDIVHYTPEQWSALNIKGAYLYWYFVNLDEVTPEVPYFELTEYEAMGWKFYQQARGYITFYEGSNLFDQLSSENIVESPKKNRFGEIVPKPMKYKYTLSEEDKLQGIAFGKVMEPHVHRALKSQTERAGA